MNLLFVTAHPDDLEFALGATLARFVRSDVYKVFAYVASDSQTMNPDYNMKEELHSSLHDVYNINYKLGKFETMYFHHNYQDIRNEIFRLKKEFRPQVVFCMSPMASHPDHQMIGRACDSIFMECSIYCMEDVRGNQRQLVNKWYKVQRNDLDTKVKALGCYKSQRKKPYSDYDGIKAMAKTRGLQIGAELAEGLEIIREVS